jgi:plastocyanin
MSRWVRAALIAALASAVFVPATSGAPEAARKTFQVTVADDYYAPTALTIKKDNKIRWNWSDQNYDSHNVKLTKGPKGVKKTDFKSATGAIGINFARKFTVAGKYHFICTLHSSVMTMDVTVKK